MRSHCRGETWDEDRHFSDAPVSGMCSSSRGASTPGGASELTAWACTLGAAPVGAVAFRMDAHHRRLVVLEGPAEDVTTLGWQLDDAETLETIRSRLVARGVEVTEGSADAARLRGVERFWHFTGPEAAVVRAVHFSSA